MAIRSAAFLLVGLLAAPGAVAAGCGGPQAPCEIPGGTYHLALPTDPAGAPAVLWLHGYSSSGRSALGDGGLADIATARGYVVIAPNGQPWIWGSDALDWSVADGHSPKRNDVDFLRAVLADAVERTGIDGSRVLAAGYSRGGSMIWDLACLAPDSAAAYASVSGGFWEPMVQTCAAPVHLFHTHGFADRTVPLEGQEFSFEGFDFQQGNIIKGLDVWRRVDGCMHSAEARLRATDLWEKVWPDCTEGSLTFHLRPGGHTMPPGWIDLALDWFEATTAPPPVTR